MIKRDKILIKDYIEQKHFYKIIGHKKMKRKEERGYTLLN